jgi:hypothetical protein
MWRLHDLNSSLVLRLNVRQDTPRPDEIFTPLFSVLQSIAGVVSRISLGLPSFTYLPIHCLLITIDHLF